jgi:bisphosphoglycerate-independent phosphoglycerate mutase (AlkP superfamily)
MHTEEHEYRGSFDTFFRAIVLAQTSNIDKPGREWPHRLIRTTGEAVGWSEGQMGNSEVRQMNFHSYIWI